MSRHRGYRGFRDEDEFLHAQDAYYRQFDDVRSWQQPIPYEEYYEEVGGERADGKQDIYGGYNISGNIFETPDGAKQDHSHQVLRPDGSTEYHRGLHGENLTDRW